jgi:hypothetical protein
VHRRVNVAESAFAGSGHARRQNWWEGKGGPGGSWAGYRCPYDIRSFIDRTIAGMAQGEKMGREMRRRSEPR